jgi:hypothetical protein
MINTANTFPMLLHSAQHLQEQQQQQQTQSDGSETDAGSAGQAWGEAASSSSSSSSGVLVAGRSRPQQLLTVGCRHWGNGVVQGLLRVKIYDFAIYLDGQQVGGRTWKHGQGLRLQGPSTHPFQLCEGFWGV